MRTDRLPRFAPNALLTVDRVDGPEEWTGQQWNDHMAAAEKRGDVVTVRLMEIRHLGGKLAALTAEQEIRARALTVAVAYFADDDGDHAPLEILLRTAGTFAAWITDGPQTPAEGLDRSDPDPSAGRGGTGAQRPPQGADGGGEATGGIDLGAAVEAGLAALEWPDDRECAELPRAHWDAVAEVADAMAPHILQAAAEWLRGERTLDDGDPWNSGWHGAVDQLHARADEIGGGDRG